MLNTIAAGIALSFALAGAALAQTCPAYSYTLTNGTTADASQVMANFNTVRACANNAVVLRDYIAGLTLSTAGASSSYGVAAGQATDSGNGGYITLSAAYAKTTAAWSTGTGAGSLDAGSIAANTWYHVFLIERTDTGAVDVLISLSATSPTLPSGYSLFRRVGSMRTDASAHWLSFTQDGNEFLWPSPVADVNNAVLLSSTPFLVTLTIPSGVKVHALVAAAAYNGAGGANYWMMSSPDTGGLSASYPTGQASWVGGSSVGQAFDSVRSNTSSQIYFANATALYTNYAISTRGWVDPRGQNN